MSRSIASFELTKFASSRSFLRLVFSRSKNAALRAIWFSFNLLASRDLQELYDLRSYYEILLFFQNAKLTSLQRHYSCIAWPNTFHLLSVRPQRFLVFFCKDFENYFSINDNFRQKITCMQKVMQALKNFNDVLETRWHASSSLTSILLLE